MTDAVRQRACDPLFSTHRHGIGTGLGLTFVHGVVQLHGGQIVLESESEAGTVVRIWLPQP